MANAGELISPARLPASDERSEEQAAVRSRDTIVFYGDTEQVSAGFALALDAMESCGWQTVRQMARLLSDFSDGV
jgi:hypothetical protein